MRTKALIAAFAAGALAQFASAQQAPRDATSPAGSGGSSNPALVAAVPDGPPPRLPDGTPDLSGVWVGAGPIGDISMGLQPGEAIVMLPAAEALMKSRMAADDPEARCLPTGVPRIAPYPWRLVQSPAYGKATHLFFLFEGNIHSFRQIFMDGRKHPDDEEASWYGHSVGHWEGDTLVIETVGFNDLFWFDFVGHPHTTQLKTVERYTRTKFGELEVVTTVTDPGAYAKPFTVKFRHTLRPGWELMEYICNENNQDVEHIRGPAGL
jgi:hypothetical protein